MKQKTILLAIFAFIGLTSFAQRSTNAKDADFSFLVGKKDMNIVFDYEGMTVGKNQTEVDYVNNQVAEKNEKKKGTGDEWRKAWENGKLNLYEPTFKNAFTKKLGKVGVAVSEGDNAEITVIVRTTRMEPGFNAGVAKKRAEIDLEYIFVETANKDNIIATVVMTRVLGNDTFTVSDRLNLAYMGAGASLGGYIKKSLAKAAKK
jgi:hypothetical protein